MSQKTRSADDTAINHQLNRSRQSFYHAVHSNQSIASSPFPVWRNLGSALGGVGTLPENIRFFRRPILAIEAKSSVEPQDNICGFALGAHNYGKSPIIELRGRVSVALPPTEGNEKLWKLVLDNKSTAELSWPIIEDEDKSEDLTERVIDLYPEPDRNSAPLFSGFSDSRGFAVNLYNSSKPVLLSQRDVIFLYQGGSLRSYDFLAVFSCWVGGKTQTGGYVSDTQQYVAIIPNFGRFGGCDLSKFRVVTLPSRNSRSKLLELFRGLNPIDASSAPAPTSSPSPQ